MNTWEYMKEDTWPAQGHYWVRHRRFGTDVVRIDETRMFFPGSTIRTTSKKDFDVREYELFTGRIEEPVPSPPYIGLI